MIVDRSNRPHLLTSPRSMRVAGFFVFRAEEEKSYSREVAKSRSREVAKSRRRGDGTRQKQGPRLVLDSVDSAPLRETPLPFH